jgi:hypothetical protein
VDVLSGPYAGESVELSARLVDYYRRMLVTHTDDPVHGMCRVCAKRRCADWRYARSQLASAGELGMAEPTRVVARDAGPADNGPAPEIGPELVVAAQKAVAIHAPERWPQVVYCRNCHNRWPCQPCRWGVGLLYAAGWGPDDLVELRQRVTNGEQPWAEGPSTRAEVQAEGGEAEPG